MDDQMGGPQWTPADELLYADVQKGLGQVRKDLFDGEVHPDHAAPVLQELTQKAAALDQRRKQADDQAMGEQFHKAAHAAAMQQSLLQANAADTARGFPSAVGEDPVTGQRFAPPGWQQIDRPEADGSTDMSGYADPETSVPLNPSSVSQGGPQVEQSPDGTQKMTIWNGAHRTEAVFGPDKQLISQQMYGPDNQPVAPQLAQASQQFGVPPDVLQRINQQAFQLFPGRDVHSATSRGHFINRGISAYHTNSLVEKRAQLQAQKLQQDEHDKNFDTVLRQEKKDVASDWRKAHPNEEMTGDTRRQLNEDALKNAHDHFNSTYGKPHRGGYQAGQAAPVGGRTEQPPLSPETSLQQEVMKKKVTAHDYFATLRGVEAGLAGHKKDDATGEETVAADRAAGWDLAGQKDLKWKDMPAEMRHQEALRRTAEFYGVAAPKAAAQSAAPTRSGVGPPAKPETPQKQLDTAKSIVKGLPSLTKPRPRSAENEIHDPNP